MSDSQYKWQPRRQREQVATRGTAQLEDRAGLGRRRLEPGEDPDDPEPDGLGVGERETEVRDLVVGSRGGGAGQGLASRGRVAKAS